MAKSGAKIDAQVMAMKLPELTAVQRWQDIEAEIKLKRAIVKMPMDLEIPALVIRSVSVRAIYMIYCIGLITIYTSV